MMDHFSVVLSEVEGSVSLIHSCSALFLDFAASLETIA
jgi:hypothetical protein